MGVNQGDDTHVESRSRLVVQELKKLSWSDDLFAATPPLEAKKLIFAFAATEGVGFKEGKITTGLKIELVDVRRTYVHAKTWGRVFVKVPPEDAVSGMCGLLLESMYGARDSTQRREFEYSEIMGSCGLQLVLQYLVYSIIRTEV